MIELAVTATLVALPVLFGLLPLVAFIRSGQDRDRQEDGDTD